MPIVRAGEVNIHYQLAGPASGEPVIFISGLGADWTNWSLQLKSFQEKYLCLAFDNRDSGLSDNVNREYSLKEMTKDVMELTYALGLDYVHVVGHSMGGAIAQEFVIGYPERVASLTLVATFSRIEPLGLEILRNIGPVNSLAENGFLAQLVAPIAFNLKAFNDNNILRFLREQGRPSPFNIPTEGYKRQLRAIMAQDTVGRIAAITKPTLAIAGENDLIATANGMEKLALSIPGSVYTLFPNTGHAPQVERPDDFNRILSLHLAANPIK